MPYQDESLVSTSLSFPLGKFGMRMAPLACVHLGARRSPCAGCHAAASSLRACAKPQLPRSRRCTASPTSVCPSCGRELADADRARHRRPGRSSRLSGAGWCRDLPRSCAASMRMLRAQLHAHACSRPRPGRRHRVRRHFRDDARVARLVQTRKARRSSAAAGAYLAAQPPPSPRTEVRLARLSGSLGDKHHATCWSRGGLPPSLKAISVRCRCAPIARGSRLEETNCFQAGRECWCASLDVRCALHASVRRWTSVPSARCPASPRSVLSVASTTEPKIETVFSARTTTASERVRSGRVVL